MFALALGRVSERIVSLYWLHSAGMHAVLRLACDNLLDVAFVFDFNKQKVATIYVTLSMTAAVAKEVFVVSDDTLRVRASIADHLQERVLASSGPRAKGGDCVVSVDGVSGSPEVLLAACSSGASVANQLQRDFGVVVFRSN